CLLIYAHENCLHHGHPSFSLIPSTTLFRSEHRVQFDGTTFTITLITHRPAGAMCTMALEPFTRTVPLDVEGLAPGEYAVCAGDLDRKGTRLNSSHVKISYAVFYLKKHALFT